MYRKNNSFNIIYKTDRQMLLTFGDCRKSSTPRLSRFFGTPGFFDSLPRLFNLKGLSIFIFKPVCRHQKNAISSNSQNPRTSIFPFVTLRKTVPFPSPSVPVVELFVVVIFLKVRPWIWILPLMTLAEKPADVLLGISRSIWPLVISS